MISIMIPVIGKADAQSTLERINSAILRTDDRPAFDAHNNVIIVTDDPVRVITDLQADGFVD